MKKVPALVISAILALNMVSFTAFASNEDEGIEPAIVISCCAGGPSLYWTAWVEQVPHRISTMPGQAMGQCTGVPLKRQQLCAKCGAAWDSEEKMGRACGQRHPVN